MNQEIIVGGDAELQSLATRIRENVNLANEEARHAVDAALEVGRLLTEAKGKVSRGEWETWITDNTKLAVRTAQAYMRLSRKLSELPDDEAQRVALLPVRQAMQAITTSPSAPVRAANWHGQSLERRERLKNRVCTDVAYFRKTFLKGIALGHLRPGDISGARTRLNGMLKLLDELEAEAQKQAAEDKEAVQ